MEGRKFLWLSKRDKLKRSERLVRPRSYEMKWSRSRGRTWLLGVLVPERFAGLEFFACLLVLTGRLLFELSQKEEK